MNETERLKVFLLKLKNLCSVLLFGSATFFFGGLAFSVQYHWSNFASNIFIAICGFAFFSGTSLLVFLMITEFYVLKKSAISDSLENLGKRIAELERLQSLKEDQFKDSATGVMPWEGLLVIAHADPDDAKRIITEELTNKKELKEKLDQMVVPEPWASRFLKKLFRFREV